MQTVFASDAPNAIGPYSQAIRTGNLLYCSGQTPIDPLTMQLIPGGVTQQTLRVITNLSTILQAEGLSLSQVIKTNVFLTDMDHFPDMNAAYAAAFGQHRPARTTVAVRALPLNALVEIECIAEYPAG